MSNEKKLEKKESPAKNLTFLLLIVPYQIAVRMEEGGEKKKEILQQRFLRRNFPE